MPSIKTSDLRSKNEDQLKKQLEDLSKESFNLRFQVSNGQLSNTGRVKEVRTFKHPLYKKFIKKDKRYSAHDENNKFKIGDFVKIRECAPKSKTKNFEVIYTD